MCILQSIEYMFDVTRTCVIISAVDDDWNERHKSTRLYYAKLVRFPDPLVKWVGEPDKWDTHYRVMGPNWKGGTPPWTEFDCDWDFLCRIFSYDVVLYLRKYINFHPHDSTPSSNNTAVAAPPFIPYQVCPAIVARANLPTLQSARWRGARWLSRCPAPNGSALHPPTCASRLWTGQTPCSRCFPGREWPC